MILVSGQEPVFTENDICTCTPFFTFLNYASHLDSESVTHSIYDKFISIIKQAMEMEFCETQLGINILDLPNEVLLKIFSNLSPEDIYKNVALVCNRFLEVTRSSKLPRLVTIPSYTSIHQLAQTVENCLNKNPFSKFDIEHLSINSPDDSEPLFQVAPFIMKMKISLDFDWKASDLPFFQSLETLYIEDTYHRVKHINGIWKMFPNLTNLEIVLFDYINGEESRSRTLNLVLGLDPPSPESPIPREVSKN